MSFSATIIFLCYINILGSSFVLLLIWVIFMNPTLCGRTSARSSIRNLIGIDKHRLVAIRIFSPHSFTVMIHSKKLMEIRLVLESFIVRRLICTFSN